MHPYVSATERMVTTWDVQSNLFCLLLKVSIKMTASVYQIGREYGHAMRILHVNLLYTVMKV